MDRPRQPRGRGTRPRPCSPRRGRPAPSRGRAPAPPPITRREATRRIRLLAFIVVAGLAFMALRAGYLGIVRGGELSALAADAQQHDVTLPAVRGSILDNAGDPFAVDELTAQVTATPYLVTDPAGAAAKLAPLLKEPAAEIAAKLSARGSGYEVLARRIDQGAGEKVRELGIPGVDVTDTSSRYLPKGRVAAQVVGLVDDEGRGQSGLEQRFDEVLVGTPGRRREARDPFQRTLRTEDSVDPQPGQPVQLTIDSEIQERTEEALARTVRDTGAKGATAVVMRPSGGAILAMATVPRYDPNDRRTFDPEKARNRPVTDAFEPGSTFKVVTIAGALEAGIVTPDTAFYVPSVLPVYDLDLRDAHDHPPATWTVTEILERSSNIGTVRIAQKLGARGVQQWIERFGFGSLTGVDYPGEEDGTVLPLDEWSGVSIANIPIGQGIAVTQVQLARAYAAIANGGRLVTPHMVQRVGRDPVSPAAGARVMSPRTAAQLDAMLRRVVGPDGTGQAAQIADYQVAGKTGTANKIDPETGKYSESRYIASFVGYVPADRPELVVAVSVDEPTTDYSGGGVAAPAFEKIASFALLRMRIPPD